ncbi:MAG TPA: branched-chain amino acid ABC transporter permease [Syntrophobacteria bacterium]|nr:branched-chain amino acid ABC transporter permease [Syntrophobacteria bacterium]
MRGGSRIRTRRELKVSLIFLAIVALLPLVVKVPYWLGVLIVSMYFAIVSAAWNLLAGYTGQFSLAPATFAMIGAYSSGLLYHHFQVSPWIGIPVGVVAAALIGFLLGVVVLRLRGPYLALTTLSFAEITRLVIGNSYNVTRGDLGLSVPAIFESRLAYYYLFLAVLVAVQLGLYILVRSRAGLYLQAIRDDDVAAAGRGVNVVRWKTVSFSLSSAICGLAGGIYVHFIMLASPEIGLVLQTGLVMSMVVIGGMGTLIGPVLGAFLVEVASEAFRDVGLSHMLVFSLMVILIGRFFRDGLWGLFDRLRDRGPAVGRAPAAVERGGSS